MDAIDVKTQRDATKAVAALDSPERSGDFAVQFQTEAQSFRNNVMENEVESLPVVESGFPD